MPRAPRRIVGPSDAEVAEAIKDQEIPASLRAVYRRGLKGSLRAAVNAMCLACQGWEDSAQEAVRTCAQRGCPLWTVRPYQRIGQSEGGAKNGRIGGAEVAHG